MATDTLFSLSALACILAGISIITGTILNDLIKNTKGSLFNFLGALIGLFGITGMYLWQRDTSGIFGLIAYVAVFVGLTLIVCIDYFGSFIAPSLPENELNKLGSSAAMQVTMISALIFLLGEILFGISVFITGILPRIATVLFMVGFPTTSVRRAYPIITFIGLTLSGVGLIWWGVSLLRLAGLS